VSDRPSAVLFCPGRGSYGRTELGCIVRWLDADLPGLSDVRDTLDLADRARRDAGRPTLRELDGADQFRPGQHLDGENAAELIYFATMAQRPHLLTRYRIEAVGGNSLGWYTALAASGVLTVADGWRLVTTMARLQKEAKGGQILTTTVDEEWRTVPEVVAAIDDLLAANRDGETFVARSIRLGGHEVLAGTEAGIRMLLQALPEVQVGSRQFPFQLAGHGPFHTALCRPVAEKALIELKRLDFGPPAVHLIDGLGNQHSPWSAAPEFLRRYTGTTQVTDTFDFTATVRVGIREFQPDVLLCAGPGESLRAPVGHVVLAQGWRGVKTRQELFERELVRL